MENQETITIPKTIYDIYHKAHQESFGIKNQIRRYQRVIDNLLEIIDSSQAFEEKYGDDYQSLAKDMNEALEELEKELRAARLQNSQLHNLLVDCAVAAGVMSVGIPITIDTLKSYPEAIARQFESLQRTS